MGEEEVEEAKLTEMLCLAGAKRMLVRFGQDDWYSPWLSWEGGRPNFFSRALVKKHATFSVAQLLLGAGESGGPCH